MKIDVKCPRCNSLFNLSPGDAESIVGQVRDSAFEKELSRHRQDWEIAKKQEIEHVRLLAQQQQQDKINKDASEIQLLHVKLSQLKQENELKLSHLVKEGERALKESEHARVQAIKNAVLIKEKEYNDFRVAKEQESRELQFKLTQKDNTAQLELQRLVAQHSQILAEKDAVIRHKDDELVREREMKARLSVKLVGESLEQHCETLFNKHRLEFRNAVFSKDNDVSGGTKGDFVLREYDDDKTELLSIMFEMKHESDASAIKQRNEQYLEKLDRDRKSKRCEYAVLVTTLEPDNEYFNEGIVDMTGKYDKMFVIRPQFFIPIIRILSNTASSLAGDRKELILAQQQNYEFESLHNNIEEFKRGFINNYSIASKQFGEAIKQIDNAIKDLNKTKDELLKTDRQLGLASKKTEALSIKGLTRGLPNARMRIAQSVENNVSIIDVIDDTNESG